MCICTPDREREGMNARWGRHRLQQLLGGILRAGWGFLGSPKVWIVCLAFIVFADLASGPTIRGTLLMFMCLVSFFLERICQAIEGKSNCTPNTDKPD